MRAHRTLGQYQHDELYHERDERKPDERHHDVEAGMRVGDLPRDDLDALAWRENGCHDRREGTGQPDEEQATRQVEDAMRQGDRLASRDWPMEARSAVTVVPRLSPSKMGMAPSRPRTLAPSTPG